MTKSPNKPPVARRRTILLLGLAGTAALGAIAFAASTATVPAVEVLLYKNPECECCEGYAQYLRDNGFAVTVEATQDLPIMQRMVGVPEGFEGCHLSMIEGYAVAGHVPIGMVNRLLAERPALGGILLPGMPMGSPGMAGTKESPFVVYEIGGSHAGGEPKVYATE